MLRIGSIFSGIGGLELGLERSGLGTTVFHAELDPYCSRVLERHWPGVPNFGDVRSVTGPGVPAFDLLAGGFPCQPVSNAGKRLAQDDPRWLWPEFERIIQEFRPSWVIAENVPGLRKRGLGLVLSGLADLGYDAEWIRLSAAAVGAPHLRERIFVVAYPGGERRQQIAGSPHAHEANQDGRTSVQDHVASGDGESDGAGEVPGAMAGAACPHSQKPERGGAQLAGLGSPPGSAPELGELRGALPRNGHVAHPNGSGRLGWPRNLPQENGWREPSDGGQWAVEPGVGRVAHGIPSRLDRLRALGNAVVPQCSEYIGRLILAYLNDQ